MTGNKILAVSAVVVISIVGGSFLFQNINKELIDPANIPFGSTGNLSETTSSNEMGSLYIEMRERFGYSAVTGSTLAEFKVDANGNFIWKRAIFETLPESIDEIQYDEKSGVMPKEEALKLRSVLENAGTGPLAEDASTVTFIWINEQGTLKEITYQMASDPPAKGLIEIIDELVLQYEGVTSE